MIDPAPTAIHRRRIALLLAWAPLLCACKEPATAAPSARLPTVKVLVVASGPIRPRIAVAGVLSPLPGRDVKVGSLVPGRVDQVLVAEGDVVKPGQPIAHVEARPLRENLTSAEAERDNARAALENARTRLARSEKLFHDGIASKQEVDDNRAALVAAESTVRKAEAQGGSATAQLDRATLRAPIAGTVAAILVPAGQPVDGNATPVIEIADTRELDLRAPVPSARIGEVAVGQKAELLVEGASPVAGVVQAIAPLVDTATNTVMVRVRIANASGKLRGGVFARGGLLGEPHEGLSIPRGALLPGDGGSATTAAVLTVEGTVSHHALRLGAELEDAVEVLSGLAPGDRVIVEGGYALPDGARVEIAR